jgi:uncharacterized RDD family membrane protein YckC
MARIVSSWLSGGASVEPPAGYPGESLGLPRLGPDSLAPTGPRLLALFADWLVAYGLTGLGIPFGVVTTTGLPTGVLAVWLILGAAAVRLFGFTPGQFALGLKVASVDGRLHVGTGRAVVRGVMIALLIPALFTDADGRGLHDRATQTAVVRR